MRNEQVKVKKVALTNSVNRLERILRKINQLSNEVDRCEALLKTIDDGTLGQQLHTGRATIDVHTGYRQSTILNVDAAELIGLVRRTAEMELAEAKAKLAMINVKVTITGDEWLNEDDDED